MKSTAYLINTARGGLIDESALYTALSEGYIAGAGLDVMELEPPSVDNPLFQLDNVIFTAHSAHYSDASALALRRRPVEEVVRALRGELPHNLVNPEVKDLFLEKWGKR
jgi:D-3-phosphoglycerate dehydrogenase